MTLVQKSIDGNEYFTDDKSYYTFHEVQGATDTLWGFACMALGITKRTGFNSQETKDITDLAGIGPVRPTRFLLLRNGEATPIVYRANGSPDLHPSDIILRSAVLPPNNPTDTTVVSPANTTRSLAERLKEIENLHRMKLLTDTEYQDKRARLISEV